MFFKKRVDEEVTQRAYEGVKIVEEEAFEMMKRIGFKIDEIY
ncbi:unnamed protein product, partial [marine sediment metagenome]